ncbi:MAG TPA: CAP domain-containing protein [Allosphingosinicella sp.]|jgi:uncharacterized protein YkwD
MRAPIAVAFASLALAGAAQHSGDANLEHQVLVEINRARADPAAYAGRLRAYRNLIGSDRVARFPDNPIGLRTKEGTAAVDEAITFLARQKPLPPLVQAPALARAAADHAADQARSGRTGHIGQDGSNLGQRVRRYGRSGSIAETISYGATDAGGVVRQLIVDDGVPGRGHRRILFDSTYLYAGVGCGSHPAYRAMCVIDFSSTLPGK